MLNPEIFRQYDIRGIAGTDMTNKDVVLLGKGIGTFLKKAGKKVIAVGRDCRLTSDDYAAHLIQGLVAVGCTARGYRGLSHAGGLFRYSPVAHRGCRDGHSQPQPAGVQRLQDLQRRGLGVR